MKPPKPKSMKPVKLYTAVGADGKPLFIDGWDMVGCKKAGDFAREFDIEDGERITRVLITEVAR